MTERSHAITLIETVARIINPLAFMDGGLSPPADENAVRDALDKAEKAVAVVRACAAQLIKNEMT